MVIEFDSLQRSVYHLNLVFPRQVRSLEVPVFHIGLKANSASPTDLGLPGDCFTIFVLVETKKSGVRAPLKRPSSFVAPFTTARLLGSCLATVRFAQPLPQQK